MFDGPKVDDIKIKNLNCFVIFSEPYGKVYPCACFTNADEDKFKELKDNFLAEKQGKFNIANFAKYVGKNHYIMTVSMDDLLLCEYPGR